MYDEKAESVPEKYRPKYICFKTPKVHYTNKEDYKWILHIITTMTTMRITMTIT